MSLFRTDVLHYAEVKNEKNKDGGGKGQWSAWKVCIDIQSMPFFLAAAELYHSCLFDAF